VSLSRLEADNGNPRGDLEAAREAAVTSFERSPELPFALLA